MTAGLTRVSDAELVRLVRAITRADFTEPVSRSALVLAGARELGIEPFTFVTPSGTWTLALDDSGLHLRSGDGGAGCVELFDADVADVVNDLKTPMTFLSAGS